METKAAGTRSNRQYEDFEPYCRWLREEGHETLEIDVKGFKKDQLQVLTNSKRILTIHGERAVDASKHKWSRFHKEIRLSKEINADEISAKLSGGVLSVVMPKKVKSWRKTANEAMEEKGSILGVKTRKRTAIKVAIGVVAVVVTLVALGTYVARVVNNRHDGAGRVDVVNI